MKSKLGLPAERISYARELAAAIAAPVQAYIARHTTVAVERATLRCLGADGVDADGAPTANLAIGFLGGSAADGAARWWLSALVRKGWTPAQLSSAVSDGFRLTDVELADAARLQAKADELTHAFAERGAASVATRNARLAEYGESATPWLYVIVATGNIHEDVKQATAAAEQGADVIAVIRTTAQSLLDYVPFGATTEGFGGTYATQENFRIMRAALDDVGAKLRRYVRLVNYASGLCMPEIAVMGALERLDMMLNDSMYGVLFRDINMYRTFVDQHFSRMTSALAEIVINTGEDNYLTTSDAFESAHTVLASQLINERFAEDSGLPKRLMGLGHAFEMNPELRNGFLYELAQAQMAREIFPEHPLKYMPPTKFMTGDIFKGYAMNVLFNFASQATGQSIHLLGMLTEALHTPHLQDRYLAIQSAKYVMNNIADFSDEVEFRADGVIVSRARQVLDEAIALLEHVREIDLFSAIEQGAFADVKRARSGGKGFEGVLEKGPDYWNPVQEYMERRLGLEAAR